MFERIIRGTGKVRSWFMSQSLSKEGLAKVCVAVLIASLLPLVIIALYNYPADDDFGYTLPAATAWVQTHSLPAVLQAMVETTRNTYVSWQGYFVSTFLFALNPLIFDLKLYFLSNWAQLALLCLAVGYALKGVSKYFLNASRATFYILYVAILTLCVQFMPHIGYAVFWHNGGHYVTTVSTLLLTLGLLLRLAKTPNGARRVFRSVLAPLCGFMLGGMFFGPALAGFVMLLWIALGSLVRRSRIRWQSLATLLAFCISFGLSLAAPGNALRVGEGFVSTGALYAIFTSIKEALKLTGTWLSPHLFAMLMLLIPALWQPLRASQHSFRHPLLVTAMFFGVFAASLTTGIYTGVGYTIERYYNAVYLYFLIMVFGSTVYLEGALIRHLERRRQNETAGHVLTATARMGERYGALYLALCLMFLFLGASGFTITNTASISATRSLVTGEAATFHQEMEARAEYIRVTDSDEVAVRPLTVAVQVFKADKLPFQGIYGRVRYMKWYYELFYDAP